MRPAWWARWLLLVGSLAVSLLLAEAALRLAAPSNPFSSSFPLYPHRTRRLEVTSYGATRSAVQFTNRWGLRGDEPPADWTHCRTFVAVGGSTTQCYYIDDHKTWTYRLQEELKKNKLAPCVWVGNAGLDGHSTRGHLVVLREVVGKIHPKEAIFLVGANDLGLSLSTEEQKLFDKPADWKWRLYRRSRLAQTLYQWSLIFSGRVHHVTQTRWEYHPQPLIDPMPLPKDLKELVPQLPEFEQNIRDLVAVSRELGIKPLFLTQPILWEDTPRWRNVEGGFYWVRKTRGHLSAATYARLLGLYNETLLRVCRQEKVLCFDLAAVVPHSDRYFDDFVHFSEAGCSLIAQKVAEFIDKFDASPS